MADKIPDWLPRLQSILADALALLEESQGPAVAKLRAAAERLLASRWTVLVSGLCSVGKSSFVGALWGDSLMLPTAVRDCTQTNTRIRIPAPFEADRSIRLSYLPREQALDYATRDLSYYRLAQLLAEISGPLSPRLDERPPAERLRTAVTSVRKLFKDRSDLFVLHEPLTEELEKLEQFLEFLDSPAYRPGETVTARWEDRREHLMGHRRPDGRTLDVGKLLALRHVEMLRNTNLWGDATPPQVIDTPWIPAFHNARRADLILAQGRAADLLVILALPDRYELEPWAVQLLAERPELLPRTLIVFNQIDTIDTAALFGRDGFATIFQENTERFRRLGTRPENMFMSCARLPFLENTPPDDLVTRLSGRLKKVLARLVQQVSSRPAGEFKRKLLAACARPDGGMETVRARLLELAKGPVDRAHALEALKALENINALDVPESHRAAWQEITRHAASVRPQLGVI